MNQAYLHTDNMEDVRERLENTVAQSSVETMYDGEDCFITVTQKNNETGNESKWSFCVDFGTNKVQMLEPTEDEEGFTSDNEVFRIIKNFLNGGSSREKRMNQSDYDKGEPIKITGFGNKIGSSKKSIKSGYIIKVTETDNDNTYSPTYVNGDSWQSKEPQIFETEEDAQEQAEDFRKYLNKRVRSLGGRWQYKLEIVESSRKPIKSSHDRETLKKVIRAYLDKMGYKDIEGGVDAAADYILQNEEYYSDYDLHSKVKQWFKETKENYPETLIKASKTIKSGISSEQNKFNWAYNDWFGHFQMNLDRVPQYLEGVKWCDANKGTPEYEQLCKEYNCYPVGDGEKASFYNALKQVGAITSSTVYSDSFDEMVQKDFTYKGNKYTWNDSDCVYYNDNGDEEDFFMEIPEGAITSSKTIKSAVDPQIDELERRAHYALPYDNEITILNRDDKLVIKVALKDDIKRIRGEQAVNVIFAKLQGDNKFMRMLDNLVHNNKEVECIVYDPDTNERFASINF